MKKLVAIAVLLVLASIPAVGQFPSTYRNSSFISYDQNTGTLYWTETINGSSNMTQVNPIHTPRDEVYFTNGEEGARTTGSLFIGQGVPALSQMNYNHMWAFDLQSNCTLPELDAGECFGETNPQIWCPVQSAFFLWFPKKKFQLEFATTEGQVVAGPPVGGIWPVAYYCSDESSPPDWYGIRSTVVYGTGYFVATAIMGRQQEWGKSFNGVPWTQIQQVGGVQQVPSGPKPDCTNKDKGFIF